MCSDDWINKHFDLTIFVVPLIYLILIPFSPASSWRAISVLREDKYATVFCLPTPENNHSRNPHQAQRAAL